jgi:hypothetical protein
MSRLLLLLLLLIELSGYAQRPSFVYIQTEPAQPFTVTMGEKVFKSSQSGYLILSRLTDSNYAIKVNFPLANWPAQYFTLQVNQADKGFLLKDFGDKGWGLMDWQKLTTQFSEQPATKEEKPLQADQYSSDDFATLLAKASGDPSLISTTTKEKKVSPSVNDSIAQPKITIAIDSVNTANKPQLSLPIDTVLVQTNVQQPAKLIQSKGETSVVTRRAESSTTEGFGLVFVDTYASGQSDTIRLIIPNQQPIINLPAHCKEIATDSLCLDLQKQLSESISETKKMQLMKQHLPLRCYTSTQLKMMAVLFSTDESKYDFLLEAWSHVTDKSKYSELASILSTTEIAERFKALLQ